MGPGPRVSDRQRVRQPSSRRQAMARIDIISETNEHQNVRLGRRFCQKAIHRARNVNRNNTSNLANQVNMVNELERVLG
jgi:hypothetical protein